jgi:hypothetical protein
MGSGTWQGVTVKFGGRGLEWAQDVMEVLDVCGQDEADSPKVTVEGVWGGRRLSATFYVSS